MTLKFKGEKFKKSKHKNNIVLKESDKKRCQLYNSMLL